MNALSVHNLSVQIGGKAVLEQVNLEIGEAQVHVVMGPNGSGKTTLARVLMGDSEYGVSGDICLLGETINSNKVDERARKGLFVAWQNPMTIPGLNVFAFCKAAYEAMGGSVSSVVEFKKTLEKLLVRVGLSDSHLLRGVNEGFSGGEKKRFELMQLLLLKPKLAILDEIDSGLDIDALKLVGEIVEEMKKGGTSFILITHYKRLLEYVRPDFIHVMKDKTIVYSGDSTVVDKIERDGYASI